MLVFAFFLSLITLFMQTILFPGFSLLPFTPFIALVLLRSTLLKSLFLAFLVGSIMDLFSSDPMGIHALNYTLLSFLLFRYRRYFLFDQPHHLGFFTFLISLSATVLQAFLLFLFDTRIPFTGQWVLGDLLIMPLADAVYAMLCFGLLLKGISLWRSIKKRVFPTSHESVLRQLCRQAKSFAKGLGLPFPLKEKAEDITS